MSERFQRCPHCRLPHDSSLAVCPRTGKPLATQEVRHQTTSLGGRTSSAALSAPNTRLSRNDVSVSAESASASASRPASGAPEAAFAPPAAAARVDRVVETAGLDGLIGSTLNQRYRVVGKLGQGGMGAVFEAEHVGLARMVAVKVLRPEQAQRVTALKRFQQEARAAGSIGHGNICEVYDVGETPNGLPFLVMERLYGEALSDRLQREVKLPIAEAVDILCEVLAGLAAAHAKNIVHRDIKPENVFLADPPRGSKPGAPRVSKVVDFGVSKTLAMAHMEGDEEMSLTRTGMVMGTPYYMSNEQARGLRDLDARVDIYACGVMLYELLSGRRPFTAPNYNALLLQIIGGTPKPLNELRSDVPALLEDAVERAMQRDRELRFQSAREFRDVLLALPITRHPKEYDSISRPSADNVRPAFKSVAPSERPRIGLRAPSDRAAGPQVRPRQSVAATANSAAPPIAKPKESSTKSTVPPPALVRRAELSLPLIPGPPRVASIAPPRMSRPPPPRPSAPNIEDAPTFTGSIEFIVGSAVGKQPADIDADPTIPHSKSPLARVNFDDAPTEVFTPSRFAMGGLAADGLAGLAIPVAALTSDPEKHATAEDREPAPDNWDEGTEVRPPTDFDD
jgi:eukaryotic-like serine/threonine-protein kinase